MTPSLTFPNPAALTAAAGQNQCLPCHLCGEPGARHAPSPDCPACLGSGWLRACLACAATGASGRHGLPLRVCLVCDGRRYTAGSPPGPDDDCARNDIRLWTARRGARHGWQEYA